MPYCELTTYIANRRGLPQDKRQSFSEIINTLFLSLEEGNTIIDYPLSDKQKKCLKEYDLLSDNHTANTPIIDHNQSLWINRIYQWEKALAQDIYWRINQADFPITHPPIKNNTTSDMPAPSAEQQKAVMMALKHHLTIINGGPGTGKTYTVAHIVCSILTAAPETKIAFAAPTGKAAKRMEESLKNSNLLSEFVHDLPEAKTLHRLLGISDNRESIYHRDHPLPFDLIIIDEASMLSLELASALFSACAPNARLILLGDANQLAAVDAGAVLHDLSNHPILQPYIITLTKNQRFSAEGGIGKLAQDLQNNQLNELDNYFTDCNKIRLHSLTQSNIYEQLFEPYKEYLQTLQNPNPNPEECFKHFDQYRILCAGHLGKLGCETINRALMDRHLLHSNEERGQMAFHGMPILITANNYTHELYNGDIGICLKNENTFLIYFPNKIDPVPLSALSPLQRAPAYALTVHKSQGSEYKRIALVMDEQYSERLLTRELLYTGITRAKEELDLYMTEETIKMAAMNPTKRQTGLTQLLGNYY